jgi:hypothetical protein
MHAYVELLDAVAASTVGFADANLAADGARRWLAERYPGAYVISEVGDDGSDHDGKLQIERGDGAPPTVAALRTDLGMAPDAQLPSPDDPEELLGLVRAQLAQKRQQMLATMVMLGMQRIVVDGGRVTAAMRLHVDTRSAAADDHGSRFDMQNQVNAAGSFGVGPWGASASIQNTIGYVTTERSQTTEEMNTSADLASSVDISFHSDYLPLNQLATREQADRIRANTRNPEAPLLGPPTDAQRHEDALKAESARAGRLDDALKPPASTRPAEGSPGTAGAADRARQEGGARANQPQQGGAGQAGAGGGAGGGAASPAQRPAQAPAPAQTPPAQAAPPAQTPPAQPPPAQAAPPAQNPPAQAPAPARAPQGGGA